jgi:hypothetical protein
MTPPCSDYIPRMYRIMTDDDLLATAWQLIFVEWCVALSSSAKRVRYDLHPFLPHTVICAATAPSFPLGEVSANVRRVDLVVL